jgi:leader peptidase (prepilin peptidase) / N-methyltransferase
MLENLLTFASAWPFGVFVLLVGLCVGSFLNVVICRIPAGKSIVTPPSHCMACQAQIAWYDNIPVLSYLVLGGRCRRCGAKFSARYMLVELAMGLIFFGYWLAFFRLGIRSEADHAAVYGIFMVLAAALLASGVIDFDRKEIYVGVTNFAMVVAVAASFFWPDIQEVGAYGNRLPQWTGWDRTDALVQSLIGAAVGSGVITLTRFLGTAAFRKEAMGTGDAYMMAAIGAALGPVAAVLVFLIAPFMALPYGIWQLIHERRGPDATASGDQSQDELPPVKIHFGAFLATGLGFLMLILAAAVARPDWNTQARILLVMGAAACGLGFHLLGREEDRDRDAEEEAERDRQRRQKAGKKGQAGRTGAGGKVAVAQDLPDESHQVPYGPFLGAAAGLVMLIQDHVLARFGPGIEGMWHALVGA